MKTIGEHDAYMSGIRECLAILEEQAETRERGGGTRADHERAAIEAAAIRHAAAVVRRRLGLTGWPVEHVARPDPGEPAIAGNVLASSRLADGRVVAWYGGRALWILDPAGRAVGQIPIASIPTHDAALRLVAATVLRLVAATALADGGAS